MIARAAAMLRPGAVLALLRPEIDLSTPEARSRNRHRRVVMSAGASVLAKLITIVASLISVPLTLHYLGAERYGIWMIISSFTVMLSFADMGLGNGILNAVAKEHGRDDRAAIRAVISSGYVMLAAIALLILAAFAASYPFLRWDRLFNVTGAAARAEAGPALAMFVALFALAVPISLIQKVQIGLQQGFYSSLWQCLGSVFGLFALLGVIFLEGSLVWLVAALVGAPLIVGLANTVYFFTRDGREIRPSAQLIHIPTMQVTAKAGALFFVLQLVASIAYGADNVVIAQHGGASLVAQYAVPERLFALVTMLANMMLAPLWPAYGEALARGDHAWVRTTLRHVMVLTVGVSALLSGAMFLAAPWLIPLWVGHAIAPSLMLLLGLGVWRVVEAAGTAMASYMNGAGLLPPQILIAIVAGGATLTLKLLFVSRFGATGIPWASTLAFLLFAALPTGYVIHRSLRVMPAAAAENNART